MQTSSNLKTFINLFFMPICQYYFMPVWCSIFKIHGAQNCNFIAPVQHFLVEWTVQVSNFYKCRVNTVILLTISICTGYRPSLIRLEKRNISGTSFTSHIMWNSFWSSQFMQHGRHAPDAGFISGHQTT